VLLHRDVPENASVSGVRLPYNNGSSFSDIYFVKDPSKPTGPLTIEEFNNYLESLHGQMAEDVSGRFGPCRAGSIAYLMFISPASTDVGPVSGLAPGVLGTRARNRPVPNEGRTMTSSLARRLMT
jgi:hypothetical protein